MSDIQLIRENERLKIYIENYKNQLKDLDEELNADKNLVYVYEIFKSIIEKINPVDEINF